MSEELAVLKEVARRLDEAGIAYMVTGSTAANFYAIPRMTRDKDTPYRRREFSRKKKISVEGQDLYVVSPEDLILSKLKWAKDSKSEVQLRDVQNLLRSVKRLDRRYLARWAKQLGVASLYQEVIQ